MKKTWPIDIDPTCQLKWTWSTIYLTNSASASCHRTTQYEFNLDTFNNFHNLPEKLRDRQMMLNGEWPGNGCEYCRKIEDANGISDRLTSNSLPDVVPEEIVNQKNPMHVTPKIVEVYFDHTCDLKCTYCGPHYSSAWADENRRFGRFNTGNFVLNENYKVSPNRKKYVELFWNWWDEHFQEVNFFQFLGGEPFYQKEFDEFVDFLEARSNPNLHITITTNLNCNTDRLVKYISRFRPLIDNKKIGRLQITASIDCWGEQQEHIRFPLNLKQWEKNFEYLVKQDWVLLNINSAISSLSIKYMPELLEKLNDWRDIRPIYQNFMSIQDPVPLNPDYLGGDVFKEDFIKIINILNKTKKLDQWYERFIPYMEGIAKQIANSSPNIPKLKELYDYLNELDRRRNTNWTILYPWLVDEFKKYSIIS